MEKIFWISLITILYTYPGYLICLVILEKFFGKPIKKAEIEPSVSFIVTAYNEEKVIEKKILNTLEIDYPSEKIEILIVSDCSSDGTDDIVKKYHSQGVKLVRMNERRGKTYAQNESIDHAGNEILVFSDANTMYRKDAVKKMIQNFNDPDVGCVGGVLTYETENNQIELINEKHKYLSFDQIHKKFEGIIYTCIGVDGAIYAIRKTLARKLPETLTTDFLAPLDVISQGYRVVFEDAAITSEEIASSSKVEFKRKIRTVRAGATVLYAKRQLLNFFKYKWTSFFLISHKLLRWVLIFFLLSLFLSSFGLKNAYIFYSLAFYAQLVFYLLSILGFFLKNKMPIQIFTIPYYFCMYNLSSLFGLIVFLFGEKSEIWEIER